MNNKWPPGGHVFFNRAEPFLNSSKICPKFMKIMSSRLFSCFHYKHIKKTAPLPVRAQQLIFAHLRGTNILSALYVPKGQIQDFCPDIKRFAGSPGGALGAPGGSEAP
ncbi:hypothetical protein DPMN_002947 [Dreissena polymorpha]|uniref:Uncharacterized protein n=1 Tax=Dreissena polymorpha TaxID=45954 RepID=A0A9D4RRP7_DREPO|nr:hypothetical protein DPMN_002947 [Dreissena polymorpha]